MSSPYQKLSSRVWIVVPAAGVGRRMQADKPKQYLPLANKTVIEHTLERLLMVQPLEKIIVAVNNEDMYWSGLPLSQHPAVDTVIGGAERSDSVLSALNSLSGCADYNDWVLVHDAARPCILASTIVALLESLVHHEVGGILAIPVSDTLKKVSASGDVLHTQARQNLWQAQTPQMFRYGVLHNALLHAASQQHSVTDEASAIEYMQLSHKVVLGRRDNIKITQADDLCLAETIFQQQASVINPG